MLKLPLSDYVANFYREQGIEFTYRQMAALCWVRYDLLKEKTESVQEILKISDDEKLNTEIRERLEYEEKAYRCFTANTDGGCIYVVHSADREDDEEEYFLSAENAVTYGIHHFEAGFYVDKSWLFEKNPKKLLPEYNGSEEEHVNTILARYEYTQAGDIVWGQSYECRPDFDDEDSQRFENFFLNIKSPFDIGDIVMGPDLERPRVVGTGYDVFTKRYERCMASDMPGMECDAVDNYIYLDSVDDEGDLTYDHYVPFRLWKVDSWEDKEYWDILQVMSKALKAGVDLVGLRYRLWEFARRDT